MSRVAAAKKTTTRAKFDGAEDRSSPRYELPETVKEMLRAERTAKFRGPSKTKTSKQQPYSLLLPKKRTNSPTPLRVSTSVERAAKPKGSSPKAPQVRAVAAARPSVIKGAGKSPARQRTPSRSPRRARGGPVSPRELMDRSHSPSEKLTDSASTSDEADDPELALLSSIRKSFSAQQGDATAFAPAHGEQKVDRSQRALALLDRILPPHEQLKIIKEKMQKAGLSSSSFLKPQEIESIANGIREQLNGGGAGGRGGRGGFDGMDDDDDSGESESENDPPPSFHPQRFVAEASPARGRAPAAPAAGKSAFVPRTITPSQAPLPDHSRLAQRYDQQQQRGDDYADSGDDYDESDGGRRHHHHNGRGRGVQHDEQEEVEHARVQQHFRQQQEQLQMQQRDLEERERQLEMRSRGGSKAQGGRSAAGSGRGAGLNGSRDGGHYQTRQHVFETLQEELSDQQKRLLFEGPVTPLDEDMPDDALTTRLLAAKQDLHAAKMRALEGEVNGDAREVASDIKTLVQRVEKLQVQLERELDSRKMMEQERSMTLKTLHNEQQMMNNMIQILHKQQDQRDSLGRLVSPPPPASSAPPAAHHAPEGGSGSDTNTLLQQLLLSFMTTQIQQQQQQAAQQQAAQQKAAQQEQAQAQFYGQPPPWLGGNPLASPLPGMDPFGGGAGLNNSMFSPPPQMPPMAMSQPLPQSQPMMMMRPGSAMGMQPPPPLAQQQRVPPSPRRNMSAMSPAPRRQSSSPVPQQSPGTPKPLPRVSSTPTLNASAVPDMTMVEFTADEYHNNGGGAGSADEPVFTSPDGALPSGLAPMMNEFDPLSQQCIDYLQNNRIQMLKFRTSNASDKPVKRYFQLSRDCLRLKWAATASSTQVKQIDLRNVSKFILGAPRDRVNIAAREGKESMFFTLTYREVGRVDNVYVEAINNADWEAWVMGIGSILERMNPPVLPQFVEVCDFSAYPQFEDLSPEQADFCAQYHITPPDFLAIKAKIDNDLRPLTSEVANVIRGRWLEEYVDIIKARAIVRFLSAEEALEEDEDNFDY